MSFLPFDMERWQSTWENRVRHNLAASGVHPLTIGELASLAEFDLDRLVRQPLSYGYTNGSVALREAVAALYPGATVDNVIITVGSAEANFLSCWALLETGDRVAMLTPNYMQTWGLAWNLGATVAPFHLHYEDHWEPNYEEIERAISKDTKLVVVTNPNNPTGHVLSPLARDVILRRVREVGAWLLADEVYQGAERDDVTTPSFWGSSDRVIVTNGLSKAYGLPGLRIGWAVGPVELVEALWARHDYTVIGAGPTADLLAVQALRVRNKLLARSRRIIRSNYSLLSTKLSALGNRVHWHDPEAGAICYVRYHAGIGSIELAERLREECDVLIVPGDHFANPHYLRVGFGGEPKQLEEALGVLNRGLSVVL